MNHRSIRIPIAASLCMLVLILDSSTAISGTRIGIEMCLQSVIPSLFPFFVLSSLITSSITGLQLSFLRPLAAITGIPIGSEPILLTGILGGYPVGAQAVASAHASGALTDIDAKRMAVFCNNAGPAFIFGMTASILPNRNLAWLLWFVQILSALLTGCLLPGKSHRHIALPPSTPSTLPQSLQISLRIMASVCGWVIAFRVLLAFFQRWLLWLFPHWMQALLCGVLELANGCFSLVQVENIGLRFLLCAGMLSFGGLCVWLQTISVADSIDLRYYLPGKLLQSAIAIFLALVLQGFLPAATRLEISKPLLILPFFLLFLFIRQKSSSIPVKAGV